MAYEILDDNPGRYEFIDPETTKIKGEGGWTEAARGLATAPINAYLGVKQLLGGLDPIEQNILKQNKGAEKNAPFSSFVSNAATLVPSMFIPGANTVAGAGLVGAASGFMQPVDGDQTLGNIAAGKATNTAIGGVLGAGGQFVGNKIGNWFAGNLAQQEAEAAKQQALKAMRDSALRQGREAGYVVPPSEVTPSFLTNRLESLGGKAAIKQESAIRNQDVTNRLAREALGLPDDAPISIGSLEGLRKNAGKSYADVASLSDDAKVSLEALKQARNDSQAWFKAYNRSASPDDLAKAKAARDLADQLEEKLRNVATTAGRDDLLPSLVKARKDIAKTYTVERALNSATGDVSAPVIGRLYDKGGNKYLSDGLDTIGMFNTAFPKFTGNGWSTPAPGISKVEAVVGGLLGAGGAAATGSPAGLLAAGLPLLSHPARALALSPALQKAPEYAAGALAKLGGKALTPELAAAYLRSIGVAATPQLTTAMLSAQ